MLDSNQRPSHYKCDALPTKLIGLNGDAGLRSRYLSHAKRAIYLLIYIPKKRWVDPGSNWGPSDLQSDALPTELTTQKNDTDEIRTRDPSGKWISSPSP